MPLWKVGTRDRDDHLTWERHHWQKDHFWTKSYHVTSVSLIRLFLVCHWCMKSYHDTHNQIWKKDTAFTFKRNFIFHLHWDRDKIMSQYYVMIWWVIYSYGTMWYKITQNFNSLRCSVLKISAFQFGACHGFRAGASVHILFVGGVCVIRFEWINNLELILIIRHKFFLFI